MQKITQKKLARYASLSNKIDALKAEYYQIKQELILDLDAGQTVEAGARTAILKQEERRTVSWREVVVRELGETYAKKVLGGTKPTPYFKLVVK